MELAVGQSFGDYEILGTLGSGGMGKVYKVRNKISDRVEAMNLLLADLGGQPELEARFTREIRIFGSLNHPNIAELRTALRVENQVAMIMEFVEGSIPRRHDEAGSPADRKVRRPHVPGSLGVEDVHARAWCIAISSRPT